MLLTLAASSSVSAIVASGGINLENDSHWGSSPFKPLKRQGNQTSSTTLVPVIVIEEDKETGLLYAKARFYDPDSGIFLSEDAWEGDEMIAPSLHRYIYVYQNPAVFTDPTGEFPVTRQIRDFLRGRAGKQSSTSSDLSQHLGNSFVGDVGVRGVNALTGIGSAVIGAVAEGVNLVDLTLDASVGSSAVLQNTAVGRESRQRVQDTGEFLKNGVNSVSESIDENGVIGTATSAAGSVASAVGGNLKKTFVDGDLEAAATFSGVAFEAAVGGAAVRASKLNKLNSKDKVAVEADDVIEGVDIELTYKRNPKHDKDKFYKETNNQKEGLESQTAGEIKENIENFRKEGRKEGNKAVNRYKKKNNVPEGEHVTHRSDCCIGGKPNDISGTNDGGINSSIGKQNANQADGVYDAVKDAPEDAKVNVNIEVEEK